MTLNPAQFQLFEDDEYKTPEGEWNYEQFRSQADAWHGTHHNDFFDEKAYRSRNTSTYQNAMHAGTHQSAIDRLEGTAATGSKSVVPLRFRTPMVGALQHEEATDRVASDSTAGELHNTVLHYPNEAEDIGSTSYASHSANFVTYPEHLARQPQLTSQQQFEKYHINLHNNRVGPNGGRTVKRLAAADNPDEFPDEIKRAADGAGPIHTGEVPGQQKLFSTLEFMRMRKDYT